MAHLFICPNCGHRSTQSDRTAGFRNQPKGCSKCGFGFLFELLDDYYPAPNAAFFVCDQQARLLDIGKGGFELTGLKDEQVIGRQVKEVLGLEWMDEGDGGGAADTNQDGAADPIAAVKALTHGRGADVVLECAGHEKAFALSAEIVRPGGEVVFLGKVNVDRQVAFRWGSLMGEKRFTRSSYGGARPRRDFPLLAQSYLDGKLKLDELIRVNEKARNRLLRLEELTEDEMEHIRRTFTQLAQDSPPLTDEDVT